MTDKCDICGSTTVDHTELNCSMNRQIFNRKTSEQSIRADERQKLLAEIEGWLVDEQQIPEAHIESAIKVSDDWSLSYESDLITARNILRAELRAKLEAMKGGKWQIKSCTCTL